MARDQQGNRSLDERMLGRSQEIMKTILKKIQDLHAEVSIEHVQPYSHGSEGKQPLNLSADLQMPGARVLVIGEASLPPKKKLAAGWV